MANRTITGLGATAISLDGTEKMEVVQGGISKQSTTQLVANLAALAYAATSTTSLAIAVAQKSLTTQSSLAYVAGARVRIASTANPTVDFMEGEISSYSSTTMVVEVDRIGGSGTFASWNISLAGDIGGTGTIAVGTVTTGAAGSSVSVTNSGTATAAIFDFTIPRGDAGAGSGDVVGPAAATGDSLARFSGTTGKLLKDGAIIGTDVQAYDAGLASIAGLVTAADKIIYTTALDTYAVADLTAFARTLLDDANAAAALATIGAQASDAELTAIAGLTSAADKGIYFTGIGTAATFDFTTFARSLVDDADAGTARTTLGLVIGTNVQAFDATLTSIAALGTAADKIAYTTGIDTWAEAAITTFGRSLIDDADAATARTTLGLVIGTNVQAFDATLTSLAALGTAADKIAYTTGIDTWAETALTSAARTLLDDSSTAAMATTLGLGTGDSPQLTAVNIGHATDTTLARLAAGVPTIEGSVIGVQSYTTTATAAGTTTLTVSSTQIQYFTGTSTQTVVLPVTSTLALGFTFKIVNNSTGVVTVQSSGANNILVMGPSSEADFICILTSGTSAASWDAKVRYQNVPINSQSAAYTTVLSDAGKCIFHPSADTTARTFTIDSNANVPFPVGTVITFVNQISAGVVTIAITTDTMYLAGAGTTGSRTLAAHGMATALKMTSTAWIISGSGLT